MKDIDIIKNTAVDDDTEETRYITKHTNPHRDEDDYGDNI